MNAHTEPTIAFASGFGQSDTHAPFLSDGRPNPSKSAGQPYDVIDGKQIVAMIKAPPSVPKEKARWFIPSHYSGPDARSHDAQRANGSFAWLPIDVDQNNLALDEILTAVHAVAPNATCMIYSSRSAKPDNRKWRALVPLRSKLAGADYADTATAFYELLEVATHGALIPDRALARPGQLIYLPNKGEFYEYRVHKGDLLDLGGHHAIIQHREEARAKLAASLEFARKDREKRTHRRPDSSTDVKPVDHFNDAHSVADLLGRYGYHQAGQSQDWRSPMQTTKSFATKDFGSYWVSLSSSDAAAGVGRATPHGHRHGDAFDLYVFHEKGGDFTAAVRDYAEEAGLRAPSEQRAASPSPVRAKDDDRDETADLDEAMAAEDAEPAPPSSDWPFKVNKGGVWKRSERMEKETGRIITKWAPICSELRVLAETRDGDGEEWGRLLEVVDRDGRRKRWAMPMSLMSGDGSAIRERLFSLGLVPSQASNARQALLEYIGSAQPEEKVRCVARIGWSGGAFVLPSQTIGVF
ncbi:DUF927 domain-containing protein [Cereibacter sp. SYSU M97828]|nr:DUF927 domain-containing protein [Cereibacter flavus]